MFHKARTEAERQKIFDEYLLGILKKKKVIKTNQKIIDESGFSFDPDADNKQLKGAFNNYVDTLVVKNYMIEQLQTRLKISKSLSTQFVNKLNGNQVLILSKNLNDFIKYVDDNHNNINDYILMSSFNNLQKDYNITIQKEKNKEVIRDNQQETGEILQESIPADELEGAEEEEAPVVDENIYSKLQSDDEEEDETEDEEEEEESEINKFNNFLNNSVLIIKGVQGYGHARIKKELLGLVFQNGDYEYYSKLRTEAIRNAYLEEFKKATKGLSTKDQRDERLVIQEAIKDRFLEYFNDTIIKKNKGLFIREIVGTGYGMSDNTYINIGKYLVHRNNLLGGKLQVRSPNKNQVYGFKSQNITNNIKDILLKLNKKEPISFKDVDKLNEQEKNQLYTIGKKLHVSELFDIPSTLKSNEDKLKDEFFLLRGSIMAGNNNPDLLRKFKIVLLKMKNNKLISLQEYNEVLNILLEIDI